jgi:Uncharacterised nucleotidyltransferase
MISNEYKILAWAADFDPAEEQLEEIRGRMSTLSNTDHLIALAVKEGLAGFLYKSLLKAGFLETLIPTDKQKLYNNYYLTIRHNLKLIHTLNEILGPFDQNDIQVVLMQGISLLQQVYRDIGLRPMTDMDLWVLPPDYPKLIDCLIDQGFRRNSLYPDTFIKGEIMLDIHTHILGADRIRNRDLLLTKCQENIFNNAQVINFERTAALCLSPSDQFLYLSLHALKHNFERLIWLVDIKNLVSRWKFPAWHRLMNRAEELGQKATLDYMIYLLKNIFCFKLPSEISAHFDNRRPDIFERKILQKRVNGDSIPTWAQLILISTGKRMRERISFVKETLFPRPKILRQVFPDSDNFSDGRLYWKRFLQLLGSFKVS